MVHGWECLNHKEHNIGGALRTYEHTITCFDTVDKFYAPLDLCSGLEESLKN